jgi:hypothetical protein
MDNKFKMDNIIKSNLVQVSFQMVLDINSVNWNLKNIFNFFIKIILF